jgi:endonuclease/exonuclease/phosphatase family metal-dependent hydrolase
VVLVGDLNTTEGSESFNALTGLISAWWLAEAVGETAGGTYPSSGQVIDHIMCSNDLSVPFYSVVTDARNQSDHRPIYAWVKY